jgi:NADH-quinone oxidoreductase subunit K/NAD(P)H-quinone oxidoreductase subunit 4L
VSPADYSGQIFAILIVTIGAIEMAIGLGLMMLLYRQRQTVQVDKYQSLRG